MEEKVEIEETLTEAMQKTAEFIRHTMMREPARRFDDRGAPEVFKYLQMLFGAVAQDQETQKFENWACSNFGSYPMGASIYSAMKYIWELRKKENTNTTDEFLFLLLSIFELGQKNPHRAGEGPDRPLHNVWVQEIEKLQELTRQNNPKSNSNSQSIYLGWKMLNEFFWVKM